MKFINKHNVIISLILSVIGMGYALYEHYNPLTTRLNYYILESFDLISYKKNIHNLDIYINGENIKKDSLNLRMYKIELVNDGEETIQESVYAKEIPFGLRVSNGKIASFDFSSSDKYLEENLKPRMEDSSSITLNKVIFDPNKSVELEILIVHKINKKPSLITEGKIAGADEITIQYKDYDTPKYRAIALWENLRYKFSYGSEYGLPYVFLGICLLMILYSFFDKKLAVKKEEKKKEDRRQRILQLYNYPLKELTNEQIAMVKIYTNLEEGSLNEVLNILLDYQQTKEKMEKELEKRSTVRRFKTLAELEKVNLKTEEINYESDILFVYDILSEHHLFNTHDAPFVVKYSFIDEVKRILNNFPKAKN